MKNKLIIVGITGFIVGLFLATQLQEKLPCSSEVNPACEVYVPQE